MQKHKKKHFINQYTTTANKTVTVATVSAVFKVTGEPRLSNLGFKLWIKTQGSKKVGEPRIKTVDKVKKGS